MISQGQAMQSLILGTAQWGLDYGTTNTTGRLADAAIVELSAVARRIGIVGLDTAPAYGDAEERIHLAGSGWLLQTKVSGLGGDPADIVASLRLSLDRMGVSRVGTCLVHDWAALSSDERVIASETLVECRAAGLVERIGISAYAEADLVTALDSFSGLGVAQVPVSVLDQRLESSAAVASLRSHGVVIQARSVLLQGAALAAPDHDRFGSHPDVVRLRTAGDPLSLCMGHVKSRPWVDEVVVAATSAGELEEIGAAYAAAESSFDWPSLASSDPDLLDPRRWTRAI